jgi:hypothetical protein
MQLEYSLVVRHPDRFADCGVALPFILAGQEANPTRLEIAWP